MAKVIILCGKIASGKSFYANILKEKKNAIILSVDELMLKLSDSCLGNRHDDIAIRCEKYFYELAEQIVKSGMDVIIDFGYWSQDERKEAKDYFSKKNIIVEMHYIKISVKLRYNQLEQRNQKLRDVLRVKPQERVYIINEELLQRLDNKFEEPTKDEIDVLITNINR